MPLDCTGAQLWHVRDRHRQCTRAFENQTLAALQQAPNVQRGLEVMRAIRKMEYLGPMEDGQRLFRIRYEHDSILWSIELDNRLRIVNAVLPAGK